MVRLRNYIFPLLVCLLAIGLAVWWANSYEDSTTVTVLASAVAGVGAGHMVFAWGRLNSLHTKNMDDLDRDAFWWLAMSRVDDRFNDPGELFKELDARYEHLAHSSGLEHLRDRSDAYRLSKAGPLRTWIAQQACVDPGDESRKRRLAQWVDEELG